MQPQPLTYPVAAFVGGRLTLLPAGQRLFAQTLLHVLPVDSATARRLLDELLTALPPGLRASVSSSDVARLYVSSILSTCEQWGRMTGGAWDGQYALIRLAEHAAVRFPDQAEMFLQLAVAMQEASA